MAKVLFAANTLTGGVSGCLDDILHTALEDGNTAIVINSSDGKTYFFVYDASEVGAESSPDIIIPDSNITGTGAWTLSGVAPGVDLTGLTESAVDINAAAVFVDALTATSTEINTACDGVLATAAEINTVCDGAITGSAAANGDFTGGTVYWSKIGNVVTISWSILTHGSDVGPDTLNLLIPAAYRPVGYDVYSVCSAHASGLDVVWIKASGQLGMIYYNWSGVATARNGTYAGGVSYIVT